VTRTTDGASGDDLARHRRPEPSFARAVARALGDARSVLDAGPCAVSYAPADRTVSSVDVADRLPFDDDAFDAATVTFSLQDWRAPERGLAEVRRVTRGPVVVLTRDPELVQRFWLAEYAPEVVAAEARRYPSPARIASALGDDTVTTTPLPVPFTCVDGFAEAYYARPERLLDAGARLADPAWSAVDELTARRSVAALRTAIGSGAWDARHGALRIRPAYDGSVVLLVATRPA